MVQLNESAMRSLARELAISSLRPTIYRPSRPSPRVTTEIPERDSARWPASRTVTPERISGVVKPS